MKRNMWSKELLSHVLLVKHSYSFCVSLSDKVSPCVHPAGRIHSHFVSIYIFIYKSFMFDGFFASSSASSSIEPYRVSFSYLFSPPPRPYITRYSVCVRSIFTKHTLLCLAHSSYHELLHSQSSHCLFVCYKCYTCCDRFHVWMIRIWEFFSVKNKSNKKECRKGKKRIKITSINGKR